MTCSRKDSPSIKISMPFDILLYNGGLKAAGVLSGISAGIQHYKLKNYADLNHLLGRNWHFRGLNAMDMLYWIQLISIYENVEH